MAGTTQQSQEQRGQDRNLARETGSSTQISQDVSNRTSTEGARVTTSESRRQAAVQRQIDQGVEQVTRQQQHADITLSFTVKIEGYDPGRQY